MRRSKLLKASRFVDFLRSTLSWWHSATISTSREARDLESPMSIKVYPFNQIKEAMADLEAGRITAVMKGRSGGVLAGSEEC
jgi:hypothetical protein